MAVVDEPVRGSVPPPWFTALSGLDRMRALAGGLVARPPLSELLDIQVAHVAPGSATLTMPASAWLRNGYGPIDAQPLIDASLRSAATTGLAPGLDLEVATLFIGYLRPIRPHAGNLLARGRVVSASRFHVYAEVELEDANGRRLAQATSQLAVRSIDPPPPEPPGELKRVDAPEYSSPVPVRRPLPSFRTPSLDRIGADPLATAQGFVTGQFSSAEQELLGIRFQEVELDRAVITMPASEWQALLTRTVPPGVLTLLANTAGSSAVLTRHPPDTYMVGLDTHSRFYRSVPTDGRELRAEARAILPIETEGHADVEVYDADGTLVASHRGSIVYVQEALREKRQRTAARRVLATLLFTDLVDSTQHADRLGDAKWRALLGEFRALVRAEIARTEGAEVDTAGDGFFVRFDSPAAAIDCARAIRNGVSRLDVSVRTGIHTGECEIEAGKPTGMAVHTAARIQAAAAPGEILVSETVKALATGRGLSFETRGTHDLKGVPDRWTLHAVRGTLRTC